MRSDTTKTLLITLIVLSILLPTLSLSTLVVVAAVRKNPGKTNNPADEEEDPFGEEEQDPLTPTTSTKAVVSTPTTATGPTATPPPASAETTYKLYTMGYSPGGDLTKIATTDLNTLRMECTDRGDKCVAFTADGVLKGSLVPNFTVPHELIVENKSFYVKRATKAPGNSTLTWQRRSAITDPNNTVVSAWGPTKVCRTKVGNSDTLGTMLESSNKPFAYVNGTGTVTVTTDPALYECLVYNPGDGKNVPRPYWSKDPDVIKDKKFRCGTVKDANGQDVALYACRNVLQAADGVFNFYNAVNGYSRGNESVCTVIKSTTTGPNTTYSIENVSSTNTEYLVYD
jgi:hypothetical protein